MLPILIILHGLIALVPSLGGVSPMTALVVSTTPPNLPNPPPACYAQHTPLLTVLASNCPSPDCTANGNQCTCPLVGDDLTLQILPASTPNPKPLTGTAPRPLPFSNKSARDFSYLANLKLLGQSVDPSYSTSTVPPALRPYLAARLRFPFDTVIACNLTTRPVNNTDIIYAMNFRQLGNDEQDGEFTQAVGQIALATFTPSVTGTQSVVLTLTKFDGTSPRSLTLIPAGTDGYIIKLTNERSDQDLFKSPDNPCDDGIGRDFAFFYNLTPGQLPPWNQRLLPHVNYTSAKSSLDADHPDCALAYKYKTPMSRPICPMAAFN
jgi:hypothetical protein